MAVFISWEKGPCMAMIRSGGSPAARQAARDASMGSTRAYTRRAKSGRAVYCASSLLPVVSRILPSVFARYATAPGISGTHTASSGAASEPRSRRRQSTPTVRQAAAIFSVTWAA